MSLSSPTASQIRVQIELVHKKAPQARVIGIRSNGPWRGDEKIAIGEQEYRIVQCDSVLQIREALVRHNISQTPLIVLTKLEESELGDDLLARLAKRCLFTPRPWPSLLGLFQARIADPNLLNKRWLAEALLEDAPPQGYPAVPSGVLSEETVWGIVLKNRFGLHVARPDAQDLLEWSLDSANVLMYQAAPAELQNGLQEWCHQSAGPVGNLIFRCVDSGFGLDASAIGLACNVIFISEGGTEVREAAVRLERFTDNKPVPHDAADSWSSAAGNLVESMAAQGRHQELHFLLERSDQILKEIRVEDFAYLSRYSPSGFEQRLKRYGKRLQAALKVDPPILPDDLLFLANEVFSHHDARTDAERSVRVEMSLRLLHWLTGFIGSESSSFEQSAQGYATDGGFVDWARNHLYGGERVESLSKAYGRLAQIVVERREAQNRRFGELLSNWTELGSPGASVLRIEEVLRQVVARVAQTAPVLLIVVDGMSWAVLRELIEDVTSRGWVEMGAAGEEWPRPVIAALPSLTEVSRTSLLCGQLTTGSSANEVKGFTTNAELLRVSKAGSPPVLFHKGNLTEAVRSGLSTEVRDEIESNKRQIIGVVVNAVDDHLAKGDQVSVPWTLKHIPLLKQLLDVAAQVGRTVIMTSDHGHILERQTTYRKFELGERYRADDGQPLEGELIVSGTRVLLPTGGRMIAPWCESVRYSAKKHGYHGGLTPQECVVPLVVLSRQSNPLKGWEPLPLYRPEWWDAFGTSSREQCIIDTDVVQKVVSSKKKSPVAAVSQPLPLFTTEEKPVAVSEPWIEALLNSPTFASQSKLAGRATPAPDQMRQFLTVLDERGGTILKSVLAQKLGQPELRINGILAMMRRLLNVDGYGVLSVDETSGTVMLNIDLLKVQFELR